MLHPISQIEVLEKMNTLDAIYQKEDSRKWHELRRWLDHKTYIGVDVGRGDRTRKGVYCRNCEAVILFGEMKPYRKDDESVDMLCSGCDAVLVVGE